MRRREFIALLGSGAAAAWPLAARAQQTEKIPVVGFFYPGPKVAAPIRITAFLAGLRSGGFSEPANVRLISQITNGDPSLLSPMAADLVARKVDLIFAVSSTALQAARDATTTIPILSIDLETDPIGSGLANTTAQPGGNITGIFLDFPDFGKKWLEVLKETIPQVSTVAVLWDPATPKTQLTAIQVAARILNLKLEVLEVQSRADLEAAFPSASRRAAGAVVILTSALTGANTNLLAELALTQKLPAITSIFPSWLTSPTATPSEIKSLVTTIFRKRTESDTDCEEQKKTEKLNTTVYSNRRLGNRTEIFIWQLFL